MVRIKCLINAIKQLFPSIHLPLDYVHVILTAKKLKAVNPQSAVKRREFLKTKNVKQTAFFSAYDKWGFLVAMKNADHTTVIFSHRVHKPIFVLSQALSVISIECKYLSAYLSLNNNARFEATIALKISPKASVSQIINKIKTGYHTTQATKYEKVFQHLNKKRYGPTNCKWLGVRSTPVNKYYLSHKTNKMLENCS